MRSHLHSKLAPEKILYSVHIECEGETQGLVKRITLGGRDDISHVERENIHAESSTNSKILTIAFICALMMITAADGELVVINIFGTHAPLYLLQLLLESSGSIAETFENTRNRTYITIFLDNSRLIVGTALAFPLHRHRRYKQLIGICRNGKAVVFINRYEQRGTNTQVSR